MTGVGYPGFEHNALEETTRYALIMGAWVMFFAQFFISWVVFSQAEFFRAFSNSIKADFCSRVNSVIHSLIIVPGLAYGIWKMEWSPYYQPMASVSWLQTFLCISVGYFLNDLVLIVYYRMPMWGVYVAHHIMASMPYVIYLLISPCPYGLFILAAFLMVELTNLPLNAQAFLEHAGMGNSNWYPVALYTTLITWIPCRLANPLFMVYALHFKIFPSTPRDDWICLYPSALCAYFIVLFCILGLVTVIGKEVYLRWKSKPSATEVASLTPQTKALKLNPKLPLTDDELELTMASPTRTMAYEAMGKVQDLEDSFAEGTKPSSHPSGAGSGSSKRRKGQGGKGD